MIAGGVDTQAALWYLLKNHRLSATARIFIDDAAAAGHDIVRIGLLPDRIVAATAVCFGVTVISRDGRIRSSNIQTVW